MRPDHHHKSQFKYPAAITLLITIPLILSISLSTVLLSDLLLNDLDSQADRFGQSSADLLAVSCDEYLLNNDLLSLNVLLSKLVSNGYFKHASIYSADNRLLAQSGTPDWTADKVFTAEIHYQDSIAGHLRITISQTERRKTSAVTISIIIACNLLLIALAAILVFKSGDRISAFLNRLSVQNEPAVTGEIKQADLSEPDREIPVLLQERPVLLQDRDIGCSFSILVIKLKPVRDALQLKHAINQAISLYNGEIIQQKEDEIVVNFAAESDNSFQAICTLLVIRSLVDDLVPGLELAAGIHCGSDMEEQDSIKKHAIYLASLGSGNLLTSESIYYDGQIRNRVEISEFHSSLTPDTKVFAIESLQHDYQTLIDSQAAQLKHSR